jgi:biotin-dependent carboxylase-like uncharacterized protein
MIEIIATGPLSSIQDLGRPGLAGLGVGRSGAADVGALALANRLVGNNRDAAGIEITFGGLKARLLTAATIACAGARAPLLTDGRTQDWAAALSLPAGSLVELGQPPTGLRSYLAVRGGIAVTAVLGSRATDTLSGLGPPALLPGMRLPVGPEPSGDPAQDPSAGSLAATGAAARSVRVSVGPRLDWFVAGSWQRLLGQRWTVQADSDRIGIRLKGGSLIRARLDELPSEPTLPGSVQVPPSGQPVVLGPDAPVTGGYPVLAVVAPADLDILAQQRPGAEIRFTSSMSYLQEYD